MANPPSPASPTSAAAIEAIVDALRATLSVIEASADIARDEATNAETKQESKYDTRAIEASYLAGAQSKRAREAREALARYEALRRPRPAAGVRGAETVTGPALVTLRDDEDREHHYFLGPGAGGLGVTVAGLPVRVITPASPLGRALIGAELDDPVQPTGARELTLAAIDPA